MFVSAIRARTEIVLGCRRASIFASMSRSQCWLACLGASGGHKDEERDGNFHIVACHLGACVGPGGEDPSPVVPNWLGCVLVSAGSRRTHALTLDQYLRKNLVLKAALL